MKISVAQMRPVKGDILQNIEQHKKLIVLAVAYGVDAIIFPELSLTGYEPKLSKTLALDEDDERLDVFQKISDDKRITIGVGAPTNYNSVVQISMIIFQPDLARQTYSKQYLHTDENLYFVRGQQQVVITVKETKIIPAICYESLLPEHADKALQHGVEFYIASVAKSANGVAKAYEHYPKIAKKYSVIVMMSNCVGFCDDFESIGKSSIWSKNGLLVGELNETDEGILVIDTRTEEVIKKPLD